jgi:short-subunit dehydrogenase
MSFKDKVVVITGASSGIGAELAYQLAKQGAKVVLAARDEDRLEAVAEHCPDSLVVRTNITSELACKLLIDKTIEHYGRLDILVNNAGVSQWAMFDEIEDLSLFNKLMDINFYGTVYCTHYALPHIKASKGMIVGVSSMTGKVGVPTRTAYSASKHAMEGFLNALRVEQMDNDVHILIVSPGFVKTEVRERALGADGKARGESHLDEESIMSVETCVKQIIQAMEKRKRDVIIAGRRAKLMPLLKLFAPKMVDNAIRKAVMAGRS